MTESLLEQCQRKICALAQSLAPEKVTVALETPLIGRDSPFKSRQLVELLVAVEEFCEDDLGIEFDWTSDSAMSEQRGAYRSVAALAELIAGLAAQG